MKLELPENAVADRATTTLEEFTEAMTAKQNQDIPFTNKSINNAIGVLSNLLKPTTQAISNNTATLARVSEVEVQCLRVDNNNNNNSHPKENNNTNTNNNDNV